MHPDKQSNDESKPADHLENDEFSKANHKTLAEGNEVQMRSELDDLPILKAIRVYWRIAAICMMAAFSAALEGYRAFCFFLY